MDFLQNHNTLTVHKPKRKLLIVITLITVFVLTALIVRGTVKILYTPKTIEEVIDYQTELTTRPHKGVIRYIRNFLINPEKLLKGEMQDRINILLLGQGGAGHEGPYLTDTIILLSLKPSTGQAAIISIPRDLGVKIPDYGLSKLNHVNSVGEAKTENGGAAFAAEVVQDLFRQDVHYYVRINFSGFEKLIDELDGLDIYVERGFEDAQFPAENFTYRTVSFEKGWQKMNGQRALDFVRSRHGSNGESSDFARSRRQQQIMLAIKDKLLSFTTIINPARLKRITDTLGKNVVTNIEFWEMVRMGSMAAYFKNAKPKSLVIDASPQGFLEEKTIDGVYLLFPKDETMKTINSAVENIFEPNGAALTLETRSQPVKIELQNATWQAGLAARFKQHLENTGIDITSIGNAISRPQLNTQIFIINQKDSATQSAKKLAEILNAQIKLLSDDVNASAMRSSLTDTETDIIVILGQDALNITL